MTPLGGHAMLGAHHSQIPDLLNTSWQSKETSWKLLNRCTRDQLGAVQWCLPALSSLGTQICLTVKGFLRGGRERIRDCSRVRLPGIKIHFYYSYCFNKLKLVQIHSFWCVSNTDGKMKTAKDMDSHGLQTRLSICIKVTPVTSKAEKQSCISIYPLVS